MSKESLKELIDKAANVIRKQWADVHAGKLDQNKLESGLKEVHDHLHSMEFHIHSPGPVPPPPPPPPVPPPPKK